MFVVSLKSSKIKIAAVTLAVIIAFSIFFFLGREDKSVASDSSISLKAGSAQERLAFLSQFGWDVDEDPLEVCEVIIPQEFDETYSMYNEIQKGQSLDLTPFKGKRVKKWTYCVNNYPGYENKKGIINANLLVFEGAVIGGDICSLELEGFMQGFEMPNKSNQQREREKAK